MSSGEKKESRKFFVKTYGCQMNVYDSDRMKDALHVCGYREGNGPEDADLVILNTCHIREKAAERIYSEIDVLHRMDAGVGGRRMRIAVAGCVAQAEGAEIMERAPVVDLVFGPQSYHRLGDLLTRVEGGEKVVALDFGAAEKFDHLPEISRRVMASRGRTAFLTVQEGCDKFCTFCVVPYTRGSEFSRPVADIVSEARRLVSGGVLEITLLGQNVNAYHGIGPNGRAWDLAGLLTHLALEVGVQRLRYVTSHPRDMSESLIEAHGHLEQLVPYLHLPVQSGSDRILAAMNRRHSVREYLDILHRLRSVREDIALASDFIVGFPGETEEDFSETLELVCEAGFARAYSFKYSARPGTPAAGMGKAVPEDVKGERLRRLQALLGEEQRRFNEGCMGKVMDVVLDLVDRRGGARLGGRTPYGQTIYVDAPLSLRHTSCEVEVVGVRENGLLGRLRSGEGAGGSVVSGRI